MFLDFYQLREQPFGVTPDPAYLYPSRTHCEALDSLTEAIQGDHGFLALIAEPGLGKTTLMYQVLERLRDTARAAFLFQTQCNSREFFEYLLTDLGVDATGMGLVAMHSKLNEMLFTEMLAGRRFVLIVDEAQNLDDSVLETIRLLSNFETTNAKLLQIVLAGQPQLGEKLAQPS
jgi:general secretion pathway protein A